MALQSSQQLGVAGQGLQHSLLLLLLLLLLLGRTGRLQALLQRCRQGRVLLLLLLLMMMMLMLAAGSHACDELQSPCQLGAEGPAMGYPLLPLC